MGDSILVHCEGRNGTFEIIAGYTARRSFFADVKSGEPNRLITIRQSNNGSDAKPERVPLSKLELI